VRRREFLTILGGAVVARANPAAAQRADRLPVVALVFASAPVAEMVGSDPINPVARGFVHGLSELGWIDGRTIIIERRTAEGQPQRAPALFAELLARGVDVIVLASARWLHEAAQQATRTVPTVAEFRDDPVTAGLIQSLARPSGNLTGVTSTTGPEFDAKRLQLLQEVAPRLARTGFLATREVLEQYRSAATPAGVTVVPLLVESAEEYDGTFATILRERVDTLMVSSSPVNYNHAQRIVAFASTNTLPAIYAFREALVIDGLMSYGTSIPGIFRQAARQVDRILKGTRPGDLPTEQPTKFELVVNLRTAKALGLTIPQSLLLRADEVIE
jgi:putative ABC transport system substrate-binding protein